MDIKKEIHFDSSRNAVESKVPIALKIILTFAWSKASYWQFDIEKKIKKKNNNNNKEDKLVLLKLGMNFYSCYQIRYMNNNNFIELFTRNNYEVWTVYQLLQHF